MSRTALVAALVGTVLVGTLASAASSEVAAPDKPTITTATGIWSRESSATFELTSSVDATGFDCRLDGGGIGAWAPCASPVTYLSLGEGSHTFQVRALDGSGGQSPPSTFGWTIDLTPPALPADVVAEATSPEGTIVSFAATDILDPSPALACPQSSGSVFPLGTTAVSCTATDAAGNTSTGAFAVTVRDTTAPTLASHPDVIVDQQSAQGAHVPYSLPLASDAADPSPAVTCEPPSGALFPLAETRVSCVATDAAGLKSAAETFAVIVQAGPTPAKPGIRTSVPRLSKRADAEFELDVDPGVTTECRLDGPLGAGSFTPCGGAPQTYTALVDGPYLFTVQVTNSIGNVSQASYDWVVDLTPPAPVAALAARAGYRRVTLSWTPPIDVDFDRVRIWRKRGPAGAWRRLADRVSAATLTDGTLTNHVLYRYRVASLDLAGNVSALGEVTAWPSPFLAPGYREVVHTSPLVDWRSVPRATYYNMQLWRNGRKILSVWPTRSQYRLRSSWTFNGRRHLLAGGPVTVYVWAGFGPKAAVRYGPLYGRTTFTLG